MAVTSALHVEGPYKIEVKSGASGSSWVELGLADNDDTFALDVQQLVREVTNVTTGDEPSDVISRGSRGTVTFTLAYYVQANKATFMTAAGGSTEGDASTVGRRLSDDGASGNHWWGVRITPVNAAGNDDISSTRPQITVGRCFFGEGDSARLHDFGNQETRLAVQMSAIRDSNGNIYAYATS